MYMLCPGPGYAQILLPSKPVDLSTEQLRQTPKAMEERRTRRSRESDAQILSLIISILGERQEKFQHAFNIIR